MFTSLKRRWNSNQTSPAPIPIQVRPFPGRFPHELEESIISCISHPGILFNLLTCDKSISHAALATLYHTLDFSFLRHDMFLDISLYLQYTALVRGLAGDKGSAHAALIHVLINIDDYYICVMVDSGKWQRFTIPLTHIIEKTKLPNLRAVTLPRNYYHYKSLLSHIPQTLTELTLDSKILYSLISKESQAQLQSFLSEQTLLHTLRVRIHQNGPYLPLLSPSESEDPQSQILFSSYQQTKIKKIEGSFSLLHILLPHTRPTHLRLYCNADPYIPDEYILPLLSGDPNFYQRFERIKALSFILPIHQGTWHKREFLNFIPHLHNLESLELKFDTTTPDGFHPQLYFIEFLVSLFHGLPKLTYFIITTTTTTTGTKNTATTTTNPSDWNKEELFRVLDLFRFIPALEVLDISFDGGKEYLRSTRLRRTPEWGIKIERDWWLYASL